MTPDTFMTSKRWRSSYWSALGAVPRAATFATTGLIRTQLIAGKSRQLRPLRVLVQGMWAVRDEPVNDEVDEKSESPILEQVEFEFPALSCERTQSGQGEAKTSLQTLAFFEKMDFRCSLDPKSWGLGQSDGIMDMAATRTARQGASVSTMLHFRAFPQRTQ